MKSEEEHRKEIYQDAEEMDAQIMSIEKMNFSAKDLNTFSAMAAQNSQKTFEQPVKRSAPKAEPYH